MFCTYRKNRMIVKIRDDVNKIGTDCWQSRADPKNRNKYVPGIPPGKTIQSNSSLAASSIDISAMT